MDMKVSSTIGFERRHNELLGEQDEAVFVERAIRSLPPQPPNFQAVVAINRGPLTDEAVDAHPLTPRQVEIKQRAGALVVDVRTALQFDEAHIRDSVSNPAAHAGFGTKLAWIAGPGQEVVFVGRDDEDGVGAARLAAAVGVRNVGGYLEGGMTSWREEQRATGRLERVDVEGLRELTRADGSVQILDVREQAEWDAEHIPGSVFRPYHDLDAVPEGIDPARPIAVICSSGQRSGVAASLLARHGALRVVHVTDGGVGTWAGRGWPTEQA
jgi:rhodanese-related sulfurtransferase